MKIRVWGLAAGHGTTAEAARGAFTWKEYADMQTAKAAVSVGDWLHILWFEEIR